jgi:outer membrane protein TolC
MQHRYRPFGINQVKFTGFILANLALLFACRLQLYAQQSTGGDQSIRLSMKDAILLAQSQNKQVRAARTAEKASESDYKDAQAAALPNVSLDGSFQRYSKLTLYDGFLGNARSISLSPTASAVTMNVASSFNLYSGGRQRSFEAEQHYRKDLGGINVREQSGSVGLQVAAIYLDMVSLHEQQQLIADQIVRAETRLKNINALYRNEKITRSDLLRAELNLSAVKLNLEQVENDSKISNHRLNVLLDLSDTTTLFPTDSANITRPGIASLVSVVGSAGLDAYSVRKAGKEINIQGAKNGSIKSSNLPSLSVFWTYFFNYPNRLYYPTVDQAYSLGFAGIRIQYNLSALYQNKYKVASGKLRLQELQFIQQAAGDEARQQAASLLIKYQEALDRIAVNEKSIKQASVNYRIVNAKYLNQLALLTDLLDADNLYQETRYDLVRAQVTAQLIYYQLLFTAGKL